MAGLKIGDIVTIRELLDEDTGILNEPATITNLYHKNSTYDYQIEFLHASKKLEHLGLKIPGWFGITWPITEDCIVRKASYND